MELCGEVMRELLSASPRPLQEIKAELIVLDGQYVLHHQEGKKDKFKFISPASVRAAFANEPVDSGWIHPEIQRWGTGNNGDWAVLFIQPQKYQLNLNELGTIYVPLPAFVLVGQGHSYWLMASKSKKFNPDAIAHKAPLPNVNSSYGSICWGNNHPPAAGTQTIQKAWKLFIESPFSADWSDNKSKSYPQDVRNHLVKTSTLKTYPLKDLLGWSQRYSSYNTYANLTVSTVVEELIRLNN